MRIKTPPVLDKSFARTRAGFDLSDPEKSVREGLRLFARFKVSATPVSDRGRKMSDAMVAARIAKRATKQHLILGSTALAYF